MRDGSYGLLGHGHYNIGFTEYNIISLDNVIYLMAWPIYNIICRPLSTALSSLMIISNKDSGPPDQWHRALCDRVCRLGLVLGPLEFALSLQGLQGVTRVYELGRVTAQGSPPPLGALGPSCMVN